MNRLLALSAAALLGTTTFAAAQETLTADSYFSLPQVQEASNTINLGTVVVGADCNDQDIVCSLEVYEVTDDTMSTPLNLQTLLHGGANRDVQVTLRTQPVVPVVAVLKVNDQMVANVYIPFSGPRGGE